MNQVEQLTDIQVSLARQDEQLKLLPEVRADLKALRDDVTGLKAKAAVVAAGISAMIALLSEWVRG